LDVEALERSFEALVQRHEALRTTFRMLDGSPVQVISSQGELVLRRMDLSGHSEASRSSVAERVAREESQRPFDLSRGPLLRATLLTLSDREHVLVLVMHHIVSDGWSMGVLVREVVSLYEAFLQGHASPLPDLALQYADFAVWQRSWLRDEVLDAELEYWRNQLHGAPPALTLPTDRPRPAIQRFRGESTPLSWPLSLWNAIKALAHEENATPFMVLLAAFQAVLSRYSGQDDVSVGTAIANRTRGETEGLIGFFVNTLVLRARLARDMTFRELVAQARDVTLGAYAHQDVPFEKLVEELQPVRDSARSPLFQVMFVMQNAPMATVRLPGLVLEPVEQSGTTSKFDLTLGLEEGDSGLRGELEYDSDLFDGETVEGLL
ncbi:non-ribosomal peptide synthetase, partial [Myxococcaceae bacterium JPH2]|nr:non-ribosomal peptide synthetase [Myxococcaceae bacterium JPH2]